MVVSLLRSKAHFAKSRKTDLPLMLVSRKAPTESEHILVSRHSRAEFRDSIET